MYKPIIHIYIRICILLAASTGSISLSWGQSGSFGNTFAHSGGEITVFDTLHFQNGSAGILPGMIGTEREPLIGLLSFAPGAYWTNADDNRHVDGYVRSYRNGTFLFPVGDNGQYYPAAVSDASVGEPATAAYYAVHPSLAITSRLGGGNYPVLPPGGPFPITAKGPGVQTVDSTGYWDIDGNRSARITLSWDIDKRLSNLASTVTAVKIAGWNGSRWELIPSQPDAVSVFGAPSTLTEGSVTSLLPLVPSSFTVYTLVIGCSADTAAPLVSQDTLYIYCPDSVADLADISGINLPPGTVLSFHSDDTATVANELTNLPVGPGIYYAADKDTANRCYSPTTPIYVLPGADTLAPVITGCPADLVSCTPVVSWTPPTALDNCPGTLAVSTSHQPGDVFPPGLSVVRYVFTDAAGNADTCRFNVTISETDTLPPVISPDTLYISCSQTVADLAVVSATGLPPGTVLSFHSGPVASAANRLGSLLVGPGIYYAAEKDTALLCYSPTTPVYVLAVADTLAPVITGCPADIVSCTPVVSWTPPTAIDHCPGTVTVSTSHQPGDVFPSGLSVVRYVFTDAAGNRDSCLFTVTITDLTIASTVNHVSCYGKADGSVGITANGTAPYVFEWSPLQGGAQLNNLSPGTYTVNVTDASGCRDSASVTVQEPAALTASLESVAAATCGLSDGYIRIQVEGGTPAYSYSWSDGQTSQNREGIPYGVYSLEVRDANGCTDTLSAKIGCESDGKIPQLVTPNGDGHNDTWMIPGIEQFPDAVIEIYNRWGNLVYKRSPYANDWDGHSENPTDVGRGRLPAGTYFYVVIFAKGEKAHTGYLELQY